MTNLRGVLLGLLLIGGAVNAEQSAMRVDIGAQPLRQALAQLAAQTGLQLIYPSDVAEGMRTNGLNGTFTPREALRKLLADTDLSIDYINERTAAIRSVRKTAGFDGEASVEQSRQERLAQSGSSNSLKGGGEGGDQQASSDPADQATEMNKRTIEEITVTAQKREERLQDVPISISVLRGEDLERSSLEGVTDALSRVPGAAVNVTYQGGGTQVVMRGVTAGGALFNGSSPVAYYLDTVPFGLVKSAIAPDASVYDLDRVEVLRGPQSTLYGANAQNGVVRVLTKDPNPDAFEFKARTSASSTKGGSDSYRGDAAINVPIVEGKLAARAVVGYQDPGGWIDRPNTNEKDVNDARLRNARFKIKGQPTDTLSIGLSAWLSRADYGAPSTGNANDLQFATLNESFSTDFNIFGATVQYDFSNFSLTSNTSHLDFANDSGRNIYIVPGRMGNTLLESDVFSEEILLNSTGQGSWRWSFGAMYREARDYLYQDSVTNGVLVGINTDHDDISKSIAVFGEVTKVLFDGQFEITGGLRYFDDEVTGRERPDDPQFLTEESFNALSPRLIFAWHPLERFTAYASYAEGFRSGFGQYKAVIIAAPNFDPIEPDTLRNYEIGARGALFDGRVNLDASAYYTDWQDVQQSLSIIAGGSSAFTAGVNGNSASGPGVDLGVNGEVTDGLDLGFTVSWNDLTMDTAVSSSGTQLFAAGDRLNVSPEFTAGVWADYSFPLGGGFEGGFSAGANYTSQMNLRTIVGGALVVGRGDPMLMGRTSFAIHAPNNWSATLFVDNINNEDGSPIPFPFSAAITDWNARVRPRTIGAQFEYRY